MNYYFAPLEGIGGYIYRNAQAAFFPRAEKYFSPFIAPNMHRGLNNKERRDVLPENNPDVYLVPQILTNNAEYFCKTAEDLKELGYTEVNLNLGCPSNTVVKKHRGAGFLATPDTLDPFLDEIYRNLDLKISIKTRIGMTEPEEFEELLDIYNKYPVAELIIHPRVQKDFYKNRPRMEAFDLAVQRAKMPLVYNGDIFTAADALAFQETYPQVGTLMAGRGVLANPGLFGDFAGNEMTKQQLRNFHDHLLEQYALHLSGDKMILYKMKEHWYYMCHVFTNSAKYLKRIRKSQNLQDYREVVRSLFAEQELQQSDFGSR